VANVVLAAPAASQTVEHKEGPTYVVFAGTNWVRMAGDITLTGTQLHTVVFAVTHADHIYVLYFLAAKSTFAAADAGYFQVVTRSFQFLS
jgi:hypothetical protein